MLSHQLLSKCLMSQDTVAKCLFGQQVRDVSLSLLCVNVLEKVAFSNLPVCQHDKDEIS